MEIKRIDKTASYFVIIPKDLKDDIVYVHKTPVSPNAAIMEIEILLILLCEYATSKQSGDA